ncbi:PRD domain-containing protein [Marinilactibacillus psychrotolerans]|uniref:Transcriptional antiterminator n=1 Tax=Marinilactibacillus psychrotolerans TaxID=191770 RepID=A0AAV3WX53_9LACT|nr:PRD domain-containing protein [Marinilactibacillus psychrotolerans]GEL67309.1 transcription antiterminator BglG [Marinilactibacillus psychrotolerans]GEQ36252.1 transcriptional antiterminator [Marinilactibacillus psychrotolerans]SDC92507.1 transcriptional antiterminator, BglG family [Marinilactibacillus psychrotolerans]
MSRIKKVLNTSVVLIEKDGKEIVVFGKGIGFGAKPGEVIDETRVDQVFFSAENTRMQQVLELLSNIPEIYLTMVQEIVQYSKGRLDTELQQSIYFTLMDHLHFAVERARKGLNISNRVYWEVKSYYPKEFNVGEYARNLVNQQLDVELPEEESANIAFHLINAQNPEKGHADSMRTAKILGSIVSLVRYNLKTSLQTDSIHYNRFITHVKFFVERYLSDKLMEEKDEELFEQISTLYPEAMNIAFKIKEYMQEVHQKPVPKDELTYLAVHINRLLKYSELSK